MRVAAIDVGTNSVHLLVADVGPNGDITVVEKAREQVELGRGGIEHNVLTPEAMERGIEALIGFRQATDLLQVEAIHAAATSAVREAKNGSEFCKAVRDRTGIHVKVINGLDEARLIYLGVRRDLDLARGPGLLVDIGGGSVEIVLCDANGLLAAHSQPLGHIRLSEHFPHSDPPTVAEQQAVRKRVRAALKPVLADIRPGGPGTLVGTSGSIRTLARMAILAKGHPEPQHDHGLVLERGDLKKLLERFTQVKQARLLELPGMDPRRKTTLPTAAAVLYQIMKSFDRDQIVTSERSLRDGLLEDWILHNQPELALERTVSMPRMRSVLRLMDRYEVDRAHAEQVRALALSLFDGLVGMHGLGPDARRMLEFASLLHDVGHHIDARDHNKHGQYLILNSRLSAFTAPEVAVLANVVRFHRGTRPKRTHRSFATLSRVNQRKVEVLSAMVRLADAMDRSHHQPISDVRATTSPDGVTLEVVARDEAFLERWAAERRAGVLASVLGRPVRVVLVPDPTVAGLGADESDQVE